jgi:AraC-like DNA-binding protein
LEFNKLFLTHLLSDNKLTPSLNIIQCLPNEYLVKPELDDSLLSLLASGYIKSYYPYRYESVDLPCLCILYTVSGSGVFETEDRKLCLTPETFLFIDGSRKHKISAEKNSWNFYQLFLEKSKSLFFLKEFHNKFGDMTTLTTTPYIHSLFRRLTEVPEVLNRDSLIINHRLLTDLLTASILTPAASQADLAPYYLREMKKTMDSQYASPHSLAQFEEALGISKYRLSREFHTLYQVPPLQYLNRRRIEEAKRLLEDPSIAVYEAGRLVGIDNTTHFIRLFRKYTGTTPSHYRNSLPT